MMSSIHSPQLFGCTLMSSQRYNCLYLIYLNLLQQQLFFPAANVITVYLGDYNHVFFRFLFCQQTLKLIK